MTPAKIVETARETAAEYADDALRLTLRQLYYRLDAVWLDATRKQLE